MKWFTWGLVVVCAGPCIVAAEEQKQEPITAIVGGDVYTMTSGVIREGVVLVKGEKIYRVGEDLPLPPGAKVINAKGKYVLPGFVAVEAQGSWIGNVGGPGRLADSLDPFAQSVSLALAAGITTVGVSLSSGSADNPVGTQTAALKMTEGSLDGMLLKEPAFVNLNYSGASLVGRYNLKQRLRQAQQYVRALADYERDKAAGKKVSEPRQPAGVAELLPLVRRELPARITAVRTEEILAALELVDEFNLRLVLVFPVEGWVVADEISRRSVPVIITPRDKLRPNEDLAAPSGSTIELAKRLRKAGVKFAILPPDLGFSTGGIAGRDLLTLPLEAAFAVRGGLDEETALQSITLHAAQILGVEDRVGSIQEGKDADLIILDGHPFDYKTFVETTIINGKVLYEKDKAPYFSHIKRPE
jgi:imidazolonepropionase-like amidohydrolase